MLSEYKLIHLEYFATTFKVEKNQDILCHKRSLEHYLPQKGFPGDSAGKKNAPALQEIPVQSLTLEDPLDQETAAHSGTLVWEMPWREDLGGLQSMGLQRVRHYLAPKQQQNLPQKVQFLKHWQMVILIMMYFMNSPKN